MADTCPHCGASSFSVFHDAVESFKLHLNPASSLWTSIKGQIQSIKSTSICRCGNCGGYGFVCASCDRSVPLSSRVADGTIISCRPGCSEDNIVRNPNHLLGKPPK